MSVKRFSKCDTINGIAKQLVKMGWVVKSKNRHYRLENPESRQCVTVPGSPSDHRVTQNWIHQLRRSGVSVCC